MAAGRLIVCGLGDAHPLMLPASRIAPEREYISGGERSMYELAVAAATAGLEVELRGDLNGPILQQIASAAGASPTTGLPMRRPETGDIVVTPEGGDPEILATSALSGARWIMYLLAAPGLFGWSFLPNWSAPDPLTVPIRSLGRPDTYRRMEQFGLRMWTNAHGIADMGEAAGVSVEWIGTGTPVSFPPAPEKAFDIAVVENNRWLPLVDEILSRLPPYRVTRIPAVPSTYSLSEHLSEARVLVWPSRVEGMSRIAREARAVGTVPVSLDLSPFVTAEDHGDGVVLVESFDAMAMEVEALLNDPDRLAALRDRAIAGVREQTDWPSFVARVEKAVALVESSPEPENGFVRQAIGDRFHDRHVIDKRAQNEVQTRLGEELMTTQGQLDEVRRWVERYSQERSVMELELGRSQATLGALSLERSSLQAQLAQAHGELAAITERLHAHEHRLLARLIDHTPIGRLWRLLRRIRVYSRP